MTKVVIIQEYVPEYRVAFFDRLVEIAFAEGIEVTIAAGRANEAQARRGDSATPPYLVPIVQKEIGLGARRLVFRNTLMVVRGSNLIILEQARRNLDVYLLFLPRALRQIPCALWGHGRDYVEKRSRFSVWLQSSITRRSDWFFAYTPGGAQYVGNLPFPREQITTVMNSVDTAEIRKQVQSVGEGEITEFRRKWGFHGRVVSFIGALDESKRIPFLLESIRLMGARSSHLSFVIAGDGPLRHHLTKMATDLPNVHFIGRADAETKKVLLATSELLLVPGRVGLVAVDSLAAGIPIATTEWSFHAPEFEYLVPDVTSVISADTAQDYARVVEDILSNDEARANLAQNCLQAGKDLGTEQMAQNFLGGIVGALRKGSAK